MHGVFYFMKYVTYKKQLAIIISCVFENSDGKAGLKWYQLKPQKPYKANVKSLNLDKNI